VSRRLTILALALTALVAFGLYRLSYAVTRLQDELAEYNRAIMHDREAIQVLNAEWSYLTRPEALEELANRNLDLHPLLPNQITTVADLPARPPAPEVEDGSEPAQMPPAIPLPKPKHPPAAIADAKPREAAMPPGDAVVPEQASARVQP
jgi:cell division protein FtsL